MRRGFDQAAPSYDTAAVLQTEVRRHLLERLDLLMLAPRIVLDAGSGTGHGARELKRRYPRALVVALDCSLPMLRAGGRRRWLRPVDRVLADAERLPVASASVDLILCNLMLPWCDADRVFAEFRRVLAARGHLSFTTFGPDTLSELRAAWRQVDSQTHVHPFFDMHDVGDALVRNGFISPVLDVDRYTLNYTDLLRLAADLKATGARNAAVGRPKGLTGRGKLTRLQQAYEAFRIVDRLPATYEVVYGSAWTPPARVGGSAGEGGSAGASGRDRKSVV